MNIKQAKVLFIEITGRYRANSEAVEREFKLLGLEPVLREIKATGLTASHTTYWIKVINALWDYTEITSNSKEVV